MLRLCDIESRAFAQGFDVYRGLAYVEVAHAGSTTWAKWRAIDGEAYRDDCGDLSDAEVVALEGGRDPGKALIVTVVSALRVGTGGSVGEAVRQAERLAEELHAKGYLEALAGLDFDR